MEPAILPQVVQVRVPLEQGVAWEAILRRVLECLDGGAVLVHQCVSGSNGIIRVMKVRVAFPSINRSLNRGMRLLFLTLRGKEEARRLWKAALDDVEERLGAKDPSAKALQAKLAAL